MKEKEIAKLLVLLDEAVVQYKIKQIVSDIFQTQPLKKESKDVFSVVDIENTKAELEQYRAKSRKLEEENAQQLEIMKRMNTAIQDQKNKIELLENQKKDAEDAKQTAEQKIKTLAQKNQELEQGTQSSAKELMNARKELAVFQQHFQMPTKLFEKYRSLPQHITESLERVLSANNLLEFIIKGVQWENLQGLEEYILANLDFRTVSENDVYILKEIYDGLFVLFCEVNSNCARLGTRVGEEFDLEYHTKGAGSKGVSGEIEAVLFDGYRKGNYIRKSVVRIKG